MDFGIKGHVAMVAAASKGIGFAVAKALANEGCAVSICARTSQDVDHAVRQLGDPHIGCTADVTNPTDLENWYETTTTKLSAPSILVTNTGGPPAGFPSELTDEQWRQGVDSTLMNVVRLTRLVTPPMRSRGFGRIIHISSLYAYDPELILTISSTLRAGLRALTKLQAKELAPYGLTVNAVLPGHTLTERQLHLADVRAQQRGSTRDAMMEEALSKLPMGRFATPDEVAATVAFLASVQAASVSGVSLLVDGANTASL